MAWQTPEPKKHQIIKDGEQIDYDESQDVMSRSMYPPSSSKSVMLLIRKYEELASQEFKRDGNVGQWEDARNLCADASHEILVLRGILDK